MFSWCELAWARSACSQQLGTLRLSLSKGSAFSPGSVIHICSFSPAVALPPFWLFSLLMDYSRKEPRPQIPKKLMSKRDVPMCKTPRGSKNGWGWKGPLRSHRGPFQPQPFCDSVKIIVLWWFFLAYRFLWQGGAIL